jgi:hypothetical protein
MLIVHDAWNVTADAAAPLVTPRYTAAFLP